MLPTLTPGVKPKVTAKFAVSLAVISRPPWRTNSCRFSRPDQPRPGRMSSVSSILPRLGVSCEVFQGSGLPYIGMPLTMVCGLPRTPGANTMTSYFERRSGRLRYGLRADVVVGDLEAVELHAPPALGLRAQPGVHHGDARGARRMGFDLGRFGHGEGLHAQFGGCLGRDRRRALSGPRSCRD